MMDKMKHKIKDTLKEGAKRTDDEGRKPTKNHF